MFVVLQLVDEEFDALEGFFYVLEHGILQLLENVETYLHHLQVGGVFCVMQRHRVNTTWKHMLGELKAQTFRAPEG